MLAVVGPLARTASDLGLALDVIAGPDGDEAKGYRLDLPAARHRTLKDFRVLVLDRHPLTPTDPEIRAAVDGLATNLEALRTAVARSSELLPDLTAQQEVFLGLLGAAMSRGAPGATPINAHQWMELLDAQMRFRRQWAELFQTFDVVLAPTFGVTAFPHDDNPNQQARTHLIDGQPTPYMAQIGWPGVALLPNLPATACPIGLSRTGLPISA